MLRWFEQNGPEGDVVISSRVRLARNLKDYNFSKIKLIDKVKRMSKEKKHYILKDNRIVKEHEFLRNYFNK